MTKASKFPSLESARGLQGLGETASALDMSTKTLRGHIKDGSIPWISVGRGEFRMCRKFDPKDIETFKQSRKFIGEAVCPSTKGKAKALTPSTSLRVEFGLREIRDQRIAAKRNESKIANAKKRRT